MGKTQKVLTVCLWALLVVAMVGIVATRATRSQPEHDVAAQDVAQPLDGAMAAGARQHEAAKPAALFAAPAFKLLDQTGGSFGSDDLRGKVWIADFVFTHCAGPCPIMTGKMADVQKALTSPDVKLVSFSVDPDRDTPAVLKEYAQRFGADDARWKFLTGSKQQMAEVAQGMKVAAKDDPDGGVTHSTMFLLVDRNGEVVRLYHNEDEAEMKRLPADAEELASKPPERQ
jgi:protein SCO1/2